MQKDALSNLENDLDPDWMWEIVDKHRVGHRSENPLGAVSAMLADASFDLNVLVHQIFCDQALTPETLQKVQNCAELLADVGRLAPLCPSKPIPGVVTEQADGTLNWTPTRNRRALQANGASSGTRGK